MCAVHTEVQNATAPPASYPITHFIRNVNKSFRCIPQRPGVGKEIADNTTGINPKLQSAYVYSRRCACGVDCLCVKRRWTIFMRNCEKQQSLPQNQAAFRVIILEETLTQVAYADTSKKRAPVYTCTFLTKSGVKRRASTNCSIRKCMSGKYGTHCRNKDAHCSIGQTPILLFSAVHKHRPCESFGNMWKAARAVAVERGKKRCWNVVKWNSMILLDCALYEGTP